jgi:hypothetical protein
MKEKEFKEQLKKQVREYVQEHEDIYEGKDPIDIFNDVVEELLNDAITDGVYMAIDDMEQKKMGYDYCDAHEEQWKIEGRWRDGE